MTKNPKVKKFNLSKSNKFQLWVLLGVAAVVAGVGIAVKFGSFAASVPVIKSPAAGAILTGTSTVTAYVSCNYNFTCAGNARYLNLYVDGTLRASIDPNNRALVEGSDFKLKWDTTKVVYGNHNLKVKLLNYNKQVMQESAKTTVYVDNKSYVSITQPVNGSIMSGPSYVSAEIFCTTVCGQNAKYVKFFVDNELKQIKSYVSTQKVYNFYWDTRLTNSSEHTAKVEVQGTNNNNIFGTSIKVWTNNPSYMKITQPLNYSDVSGTVAIKMKLVCIDVCLTTAKTIKFSVDNNIVEVKNLASPASGDYAFSWESSVASVGQHALKLGVYDESGVAIFADTKYVEVKN